MNNLIQFTRREKKQILNNTLILLTLAFVLFFTSVIVLWSWSELNYDKHFKDYDQIYRVCSNVRFNGADLSTCMAPPPLAKALKDEFPDIEKVTRLWNWDNISVSYKDELGNKKIFNEKKLVEVDENFIDFFGLKVLQGSSEGSLDKPWKFVLTKKTAIRYFGEEAFNKNEIVGKSLRLSMFGFSKPCEITAIIDNIPKNSHFDFDIFFSFVTDPASKSLKWTNNTIYTYLKVNSKVNVDQLESKMNIVVKKYLNTQLKNIYNTSYEEMVKNGDKWNYSLQPLKRIHLHSNFERELSRNGNIQYVLIIIFSGIIILIIAMVNFINFNLGNALKRQKEFGIYFLFGAVKLQRSYQLILENFVKVSLAAMFSYLALLFFLDDIQFWTGISVIENDSLLIGTLLIKVLLISMICSIPALILINKKGIITLISEKVSSEYKFFNIRNMLVIVQFLITFFLMFFAITISQQFNYFLNKSTGFDTTNKLVISDPSMRLAQKENTFISNLLKYTLVDNVSVADDYPGRGKYFEPAFVRDNINNKTYNFKCIKSDDNFIPTYGLKVLAGRTFFKGNEEGAKNELIINEKGAKELGFINPEDALGEKVTYSFLNQSSYTREVVGVVKDFNYESFHKNITPLIIQSTESGFFYIVKFKGRSYDELVSLISKEWNKLIPDVPLEYEFLDEKINKVYEEDIQIKNIIIMFALFSLIISIFGLIGIINEYLKRKEKVIAIKKICGANVANLLLWLVKYFGIFLFLAFIPALSLSIFLSDKWLNNYNYRIEIPIFYYLLIALFVFSICVALIIIRSLKVLISNPSIVLKEE